MIVFSFIFFFFFFNDTATTEIYTLSLHDALPIWAEFVAADCLTIAVVAEITRGSSESGDGSGRRSEEHTSELQSQSNLVCRLLLEKKKKLTQALDNSNVEIEKIHNVHQVINAVSA